jgi:serine/threonine-protein kinase
MQAFTPGTLVADRYQIVAPLGRGGMGHVYRARHVGLHKDVALKVIGASKVNKSAARFEREAQAIARLDHPGCVRVLDHGRTADGAQYLAMELVEGPTLAAALKADGPLSPARAVGVARSMLAALAHAHGRGVLHRDLKPENVILAAGAAPRPVLIDFGLASLRDAGPLTADGMCLGSPSYIAPERLIGRRPDERSDVYAVGVILYELLAGTPPFGGGSPEEIMHEVLNQPFRSLRALRPDVSPVLEAIVRRALARDPAHRFADAEDMMSALDEPEALDSDGGGLSLEAGPTIAAAAGDASGARADSGVVLRASQPADLSAAGTMAIEIAQLEAIEPSPWSRFWGWLRFGRWRARLRGLRAASGAA